MKTLWSLIVVLALSAPAAHAQADSFQLIRNATFTIQYAGHKILVDPMFAPKHTFPSIAGKSKNPTVDLPAPAESILKDVALVLVTHTHFDHFDSEAVRQLDKSLKVLHQPADSDTLQKLGFTNAQPLRKPIQWNTIRITPVQAQHGTGRSLELMGHVTGFILEAENHPTAYIVGDAVWTEEIYKNIQNYKPDFIIINTGGASVPGMESTPIIMDEYQAMSLIQESGAAQVIAIHMEAIDHCKTTRRALKKEAAKHQIGSDKLLVPKDGETILLNIRQ